MSDTHAPSVPELPRDPSLLLAQGAVLSGMCRLVPVPFLDDILLRRAHRHMLASLLLLRGRGYPVDHLRPLYADTGSCLLGLVWFLITLPFKLVWKILAKLLKTLFFFLAIRDAALQVGFALLLGRAVDRCLLDERLPPTSAGPSGPAWEGAGRARAAAEQAFQGSDWRLIRQALFSVLRGARGLRHLAGDVVRRLRRQEGPTPSTVEDDLASLPSNDQKQFQGLSQKLLAALQQPEVLVYMEEFDRRFDQAWESLPRGEA